MTVFHWVRHGPTHQKALTGWRDVPADLTVQEKIARLSAFLPQDSVVVSSDLDRSVKTADALQGPRKRLAHMPGLREFHFGAWDGKGFKEVSERHQDLSRTYWEKPGDVAPPGGESWNASAHRIGIAADILQRQGHPNVIVVAHFGAILTQIQRALSCSAAEILAQKIDNLSVSTIDLSGRAPRVMRINHLP